jgi:hypothetical protein
MSQARAFRAAVMNSLSSTAPNKGWLTTISEAFNRMARLTLNPLLVIVLFVELACRFAWELDKIFIGDTQICTLALIITLSEMIAVRVMPADKEVKTHG